MTALEVLRWVILVPAAIAGGSLAYLATRLLYVMEIGIPFLDPESLFFRVVVAGLSQGMIGAGIVFVAAWVAPRAKRIVVVSAAGLTLIAAGFLLFPAIMVRDGWAIYGAVALAAGSVAVTVNILTGELDAVWGED